MTQLRPAREADYDDFARLFAELGAPDPPPTRDKWRDEMAPASVMAVRDERVVGCCYAQVFDDTGYVRILVTDASARRTGVGRTLMANAATSFRAAGCTKWCLNVRPDNVPAVTLYRSLDMEVTHTRAALAIDWAAVERLPASDRDTRVVLDASFDAQTEARFSLHRGQLGVARTLPGRVIVTLLAATSDEVVAVAVFDRSFPCAAEFRVAAPELARPLLQAIRPHARPGDLQAKMVLFDREGAEAALVAAGGVVRMRTLHLVGPLG
ncbi:MAG: GNAT family N-acetyltransferase [Deltaproteobacteria bacterium]|nr:GNAT family N-acetyltransferase [Deltaproteobacteria bacterium]